MLHSGHNEIDGVPVEVVRKRIRRINIRVAADGTVCLSVPKWWATLRQGEDFLREKWRWVQKTRAEVLARPAATRAPVTEAEVEALRTLLGELNATWAARVREEGVSWKIRKVKSLWGCCHWRDRYITYNAELARAPRDMVEYVVAHEYTHFAVHNHGPKFRALMDERLPGWQTLRRRLNRREWGETRQNAPQPPCAAPEPVAAPTRSPRPLLAFLQPLRRKLARKGASRPLCRPSSGNDKAPMGSPPGHLPGDRLVVAPCSPSP